LPEQVNADYFQKLAQIFWVSGNILLHAYSSYKLYLVLRTHNKSLTPQQLQLQASSVLLAVLSIPLESKKEDANDMFYEFSNHKDKTARLSALLTFPDMPLLENLSRKALLQEIFSDPDFETLPEIGEFHSLIEKQFQPLTLCQSTKTHFEFISKHENLKQYLKKLEKLQFVRLLQQLEKVFDVIKISEFIKLGNFPNFFSIEKKSCFRSQKIAHQRKN